MDRLVYIIFNIIGTLFRFLPFPHRTGLIKIGSPREESPVFLTGNYYLTVLRVKNALQGLDVYLLVANSHGINVWCAAKGGHFTDYAVLSAIKTSGIERLVKHRKVILPQLAAAGIRADFVKKKSGWRVLWGPVYTKDISLYIEKNFKKSSEMRRVQFPFSARLEMAVAWAFPVSAVAAFLAILFWRDEWISLVMSVWGSALLVFLTFPLFLPLLQTEGTRSGFRTSCFSRLFYPLILYFCVFVGLLLYCVLSEHLDGSYLLPWGVVLLVLVLLLTLDIKGSTPLLKSETHEEKRYKVILEKEKCKGVGFCEDVCPQNCFIMEKTEKKISFPGLDRCVRCGACIVQCPFDALFFQDKAGSKIPPENIRKYKLNLAGKRTVKIF